MVNIKLYGTSTPSYQLVKTKLCKYLEAAKFDYVMEEVTDIKDIIKDHVKSVPSVLLNNNRLFEIKPNGEFNSSLRNTIQSILLTYNYGQMTKIIVPTDFSEASYNAYNFAHHLAKNIDGMLKLVHIYYPSSIDVQQFTVLDEEAEKLHRKKLDDLVVTLNKDWMGSFLEEPMVDGVFKIGFPGMELQSLTESENTIMVMGTTGSGDAFKKVFGSLSLDMIENSKCPLFLIPPDKKYVPSKELVFLSESLKHDAQHFLNLGQLCVQLGVNLRIVHIKTHNDESYDVQDALDILKNYFPQLNYIIDIFDSKDIFESVNQIVNESENNIVALSVKKRNFFEKIFHKSVSEFAALNTICPLLILPETPQKYLEV